MNIERNKIDQSHDEMVFIMQAATERDKWARTFAQPMPMTHALHYEWRSSPDAPKDAEPMMLVVKPVPLAQVKDAQARRLGNELDRLNAFIKDIQKNPKGAESIVKMILAGEAHPSLKPVEPVEEKPAIPSAFLDELNRLDIPNLQTRAAEMNVKYEKNWNKARLIAEIGNAVATVAK